MFELANPWMLLILPLPLLVHRFVPAYRKRTSALKAPFFQRLVNLTGAVPSRGAVISPRIQYRLALMVLMWICIVCALARPQHVGPPITHERSARDLMVAVDLSASMETRDFVDAQGMKVTRLDALKSVLIEFVVQRPHDRLGLIVFGDAPFLQAPFTQDHQTWQTLLRETEVGMAGRSTALGDAVGLAIKHFRHNESQNRVLVLLSDGNDTGSRVPPIEAAKVAARHAVTIYPIAIGDPSTLGEEALDSATMERVAELTGGTFYTALDRAELAAIYTRIAALEPQLFEARSYRPRTDLHHFPMLLVTILMLVFMCMTLWRRSVDAERGSM